MDERKRPIMPDLGARQPAEGDVDFDEGKKHLCCPEEEISSELPVESGATAEPEEAGRRSTRRRK